MSENKKTTNEKLNSFLEKNKIAMIAVLCVVVIAIAAIVAVSAVGSKTAEKTLSAVDEISYALTNGSSDLEDAELDARRDAALEALKPYLAKGGIGGARANMLAAEVSFQKKNYAESLEYWKKAASKKQKSYVAPIAYYNMGVCNEQLGNSEEAAANYKKAAEDKEFVLSSHAQFSLGRVYESAGKIEDAKAAYSALTEKTPDDVWAKLAKTRLLDLEIQGK